MDNPCESCLKKYDLKDLNDINNCCYQNCANALGTTDLNVIVPSECGKKCAKCVDKSKLARGKSLCYYNRIQVPVIWNTHETDKDNCGMENNNKYSITHYSFENYDGKYAPYVKEKPVPFYIGLGISSIILIYIIYIIFRVIFGKNKY